MTKQHVVLWSGGYDSTLILDDLIKKGKNPLAITVTHPQLPSLSNEIEARINIISKLPPFEHIDELYTGKEKWGLTPWVLAVIPHIADKAILYMGVHYSNNFKTKGDSEHIGLEFERIAKQYNKKVKLELPLRKMDKAQVLNRLIETGLFEDCWTCTNPQGVFQCGECPECINLNEGLEGMLNE